MAHLEFKPKKEKREMETTVGWRSTARKPFLDVSNGSKPSVSCRNVRSKEKMTRNENKDEGRGGGDVKDPALDRLAKPSRTCQKKKTTRNGNIEEERSGGGGVEDLSLDRLAIVHNDLSKLIGQIDELVSKAFKHKLAAKMESGETESFIQFLSDTHLSLKSWVPRFQNAFGSSDEGEKTLSDETLVDPVVSPSPLVSWRTDTCIVEGGKQLFLLTPLPRSKPPPATASRRWGPDFFKCSVEKMIGKTPSSIVRFPSLPSALKSPCEGVVAAETVGANATEPNNIQNVLSTPMFLLTPCLKHSVTKTKIKLRKATPFAKYDKNSRLSDDFDCDEFIEDLTSRYPKLLDMQAVWEEDSVPRTCVILEQPTPHSKTLPDQGLKFLDLDAHDSTPTGKELGSTDCKGKGESTLKKDLWTKFEAVYVPHMQVDTSILQKTSTKGFLEMLEEAS